jgi:hypothetical protein
MRRFLLYLVFVLPLAHAGNAAAQQKDIFIKQLEFKLDHVSSQPEENEYFVTLKFTKGTVYKFKIMNHRDNYAGNAVIEVTEADNLVLTNVLNDKYFDALNFVCNKTGFYDILIHYQDKKPGYSMIDISMAQ